MSNTDLDRANKHYRLGELDEALEAYQLALNDQPHSADILHAIAVIRAQRNELDEALHVIEEALKNNPDDARILNSKANILTRQHKWDEAITTYHQALKNDRDYAVAYSGLGQCLYQQNKFALAEKALEKALKLKPHFIEAQYNYALVLIKKEKWNEAITLLESIIAKHPHFTAALGQLGELYLQKNDAQRALNVLDQRAELEPEQPEALHSLAQALALTDHWEEAIAYYEKTLMQDPHHLEANQNLANAYVKLGDTAKAMNYYFRQLSLKPLAETYFNIGVLMMHQERHQEAIDYFNQATTLDPSNRDVFLNVGSIYLKQQRYDKALQSYQAVLALEPNNEEVRYIVDALQNDQTPLRAPNAYLRNLFNQYADYYDTHLTRYLDYSVPQQLVQVLSREMQINHAAWRIIDLGCGTGLSGAAIKPFARELIGIDISDQMIAIAQQKNIYDLLVTADIEEALSAHHDIDLMIAADVFSYIGDLSVLYSACHRALKNHGILLFSVERSTTGTFTLQKNMRYAHSKNYIESLAQAEHFEIVCCDNTLLRKQQKQPVEGFLVMLKKR